MESMAQRICDNPSVFGQMYELAVKSEIVCAGGYTTQHRCYKYKADPVEVDVAVENLLLEASISDKSSDDFSVDKIYADREAIRVLTTKKEGVRRRGNYYRIGYPEALLMLSNQSIYQLDAMRV